MNTMQLAARGANKKDDPITDGLRQTILEHSKNFKTSWVALGQALHTAWKDKMYKSWGYEKFEYYMDKEVGLKKELGLKLLKTYFFLEQQEPEYLKEGFAESRAAVHVPDYEGVNVLRVAKGKRELLNEDYALLKKAIFDKGQTANAVRKELTSLIRERKEIDPDEDKGKRNEAAIRRMLMSLRIFKKDMESLKLVPAKLIKEVAELIKKLEDQVQQA